MQVRPNKRQGLTTGQVSRMLGISRSTVIKFFEQGILTGWKHPLASWRVIDRESIEALAKKSWVELSKGMEGWPRRDRPRKTSKCSDGTALESKKKGLTTGEVSRMLGGIISRRTVMRFFDKGIFTGWRDPVTGMRMIDAKSVEALERKDGLATGEVSKMFGISVYKVVRLFDKGTLTGWKNPVTGWRVIDPKSVKTLKLFKRKWAVTPVTQKEG